MDTEKSKTGQKRLKILSEDELKSIYGRPSFTYEDRCYYFSLSEPEKELLETLRSIKSKAYFVLQLGYFKAKHLFFTFDLHEVEEDLRYVLKEHFNQSEIADLRSIDKSTRLKQQRINPRTLDTYSLNLDFSYRFTFFKPEFLLPLIPGF